MNTQRRGLLAVCFVLLLPGGVFGNGGAWQTGVPLTGNGAASDQKKSTNVTIEDEKLAIELHQEFAAVEVRYRMKNTGGQVNQDFFFPVERWAEGDGEDPGSAKLDLEGYAITADGTELKSENVEAKGEKPKPVKDERWDFEAGTRLWKKSSIPFGPGQTREVVVRYRSPYAANESAVSDDGHVSEASFRYSLSPASTWKGPIGKGKITLTCTLPKPEEVVISKPKDRFKKINDTTFEWEFQNLKPSLADDIKIVVHPASDTYSASREFGGSGDDQSMAEYVFEGKRYYVQHSNYEAVASSTLPPDPATTPELDKSPSTEESAAAEPEGERTYDVANIKGMNGESWAEGVDGEGIGENISLTVSKPLPLDAVMIVPGCRIVPSLREKENRWAKNNRVAELEITLNGEHTFRVKFPDEPFTALYPVPVRGYTKPVKTVKLVIKAVHRGTDPRNSTCIGWVQLRARLAQKPKYQPSR
jgi:hypothetical protein